MGLIKDLASVLKDKAKEEVVQYLKKVAEEAEKEGGKEKKNAEKPSEEDVVLEKNESEEEQKNDEEWIAPVIEEDIKKISFSKTPPEVTIDRSMASDLNSLNLNEFALYMKLLFHSYTIKKNYGYIGNALRKNIGLDEMSNDTFHSLARRLDQRGLLELEDITENQTTYMLYIPFDESFMKEVGKSKSNSRKSYQNKKQYSGGSRKRHKSQKEDALPGKMHASMDEDSLQKAYNTYVSLEIDKAKMRVGRSNFDKIYMEAVKYIDKKYGFKVLSDSEKFKEYLTQYYVSAFDIASYEEWKKTKV